MISCELDPDVVRWGLHHLDVCSISNSGSPLTVTQYDADLSSVQTVSQGYYHTPTNVENDELIARTFQEELSRIANGEAYGSSNAAGGDNFQASVLAQDWIEPSKILSSSGIGHEEVDESLDKMGNVGLCSSSGEKLQGDAMSISPEITDEYAYDGEVGKRLTHMVPIPHVPKINGDIPSVDEATSDHQRLLNRLELYDLVELKIQGDGNCQFRAVSDQLYRTSEHHKIVRNQVVDQLKAHLELYEGYVPMSYGDYLKKMSKTGEWGDHVTLQAAADSYGVKIFVLTSFRDTCYIEILPHIQKSERVIFLSFWAEVHYNSIYPADDFPATENKKKKKWWAL